MFVSELNYGIPIAVSPFFTDSLGFLSPIIFSHGCSAMSMPRTLPIGTTRGCSFSMKRPRGACG
jgi:hypothetical protein